MFPWLKSELPLGQANIKVRYPNKRLLLRTSVFGWEKLDGLWLPDYRNISLNTVTFIRLSPTDIYRFPLLILLWPSLYCEWPLFSLICVSTVEMSSERVRPRLTVKREDKIGISPFYHLFVLLCPDFPWREKAHPKRRGNAPVSTMEDRGGEIKIMWEDIWLPFPFLTGMT